MVAKRDIERFEVLGPYTGKLHLDDSSLQREILDKGAAAVTTFLYDTNTAGATLSAHGNSNLLSLTNAPKAPGQPLIGPENVGAINVGKYMVFLVAWDNIPAGKELLLDYGPNYWKNMEHLST